MEGIPGSRRDDLGVGLEMTMKEWKLNVELRERGSSGGGQKRKIRNGRCTLCQGS
jgi:hypothetical protein